MPKSYAQADPSRAAAGGDTTRARIEAAAAALVAERGWGAVTTRAVADRAGVNQALVHYHFGSMDDLLRMAVLERIRPVVEGLGRELLDDRPFPEGIVRAMRLLDAFDLGSETGVLMAEALLRATRDERMAEQMGSVVGSWTSLLEPRIVRAQERGTVRGDVDAAALARLLAAALDGYLIQRMADPAADPAAAAATISRLLAPTPQVDA